MKKRISVIITTYNSEKSIQRTLNSIFDQTGVNDLFEIEVIVVDDCSTDATTTIVKNYQVTLLSTEKNTGGPNKGRNLGLKIASGDFICITDHDDEWKPNKIMVQIPFLEKAPIVTSGYTIIEEGNNRSFDRINNSNEGHLFFDTNITFLARLTKSLKGQNAYLGSILYRKELKDVFFEENFGMVDFDWLLRLFHKNESIEISESLYYRHVENNNLSLNEGYRRRDFYYSLLTIENYLDLYPKEVSLAYKKIHGSRARFYYLINNMKLARFYFWKSQLNIKTFAYIITSYVGAKFVRKRFNIFG